MRTVKATLPERQRPGNPRLVHPVGYAMAYSHASTALRQGPLGPTAPVPKGQFQVQCGAPLCIAPQVRTASPCSGGPRVRPPATSVPLRRFAGVPNISADQLGRQSPGPAVNSVPLPRLWSPGVRPTLLHALG
ncbi:hypothetical protein NDU88_009369 [Pleurodeles waltl]|uniref:Uncharacterized protein n=1 Tax=Pleurodeles waltl TaxID=8319 RepID=A0AAV7PS93_PLEWA|nr:hypothetical protein NDU88_009369 [Pleurodeles waltl]